MDRQRALIQTAVDGAIRTDILTRLHGIDQLVLGEKRDLSPLPGRDGFHSGSSLSPGEVTGDENLEVSRSARVLPFSPSIGQERDFAGDMPPILLRYFRRCDNSRQFQSVLVDQGTTAILAQAQRTYGFRPQWAPGKLVVVVRSGRSVVTS